MTSSQDSITRAIAGLADLPNELICMLSAYMPATDVLHLLLTCKAMHAYIAEETIWRRFCAKYGVLDPDDLGGSSYFQVYSCLLHKYGSLIGLWAGDLPFFGSIIEFRVDPAIRAIVGETWILSPTRELEEDESQPPLPEYDLFLCISLPDREDLRSSTSPSSTEAVLRWRMEYGRSEEMSVQDTVQGVYPTLHILSETTEATYLYRAIPVASRRFSSHPPFPGSLHDVWYDDCHEFPRIIVESSPKLHILTPGSWPLSHEGAMHRALFTAAGHIAKPKALCIKSPTRTRTGPRAVLPSDVHHLNDNIPDLRNRHTDPSPSGITCTETRYYPLRRPIYNLGTTDSEFSPARFQGIWLGDDGGDGTEVLWLTYDDASNTVSAWKLTGGVNVPRGVVSWAIFFDEERDLNRPARTFRGRGTTCGFGFIEELQNKTETIVSILGLDDIGIEWTGLVPGFVSRYRRYPGRDPASEVEVFEFRRGARD